ncbi:hypothetical protein, partial [Stenotrophomonas sp.]|uniref:hypothetical protein n=1 Tax=Stenotrophomonas sp. TaxID=69392 RepID=UPI0028AFE803
MSVLRAVCPGTAGAASGPSVGGFSGCEKPSRHTASVASGGISGTVSGGRVVADKYCDLVMKGGITSGIVYPNAVLALAR